MKNFYTLLQDALQETCPSKKCNKTFALYEQYHLGKLNMDKTVSLQDILIAGRPDKPILCPHPIK